MGHLVGQPTNPLTSKMLVDYYNLPSKEQEDAIPISVPGQILVGSTVNHLTTLPKSNRRDPLVSCYHRRLRDLSPCSPGPIFILIFFHTPKTIAYIKLPKLPIHYCCVGKITGDITIMPVLTQQKYSWQFLLLLLLLFFPAILGALSLCILVDFWS